MRNRKQALAQWQQLSEVNVDEVDNITEPFLHFEVGTNKFTIWLWFEDEYDCSVVENLITHTEY